MKTEQKVICGDNIEVLKTYPDNYADSIVTDAPYGLGEEPDAMEVMKDWINHGFHMTRSKGGFMGKWWDAFVPQPLFWQEVYRVLKPGGYVLCFFGTRTYDWGVMAIRFAGFEIRDKISWIFATGFPKSLDISKAIDKGSGAVREVVGTRTKKAGDITSGNFKRDGSYADVELDITEPKTEEAKKWAGWGTALKPAHEPIVVARKPISEKTVAANVLKHGTGGINIDACRIGLNGIENHSTEAKGGLGNNVYGKYKNEVKDLTDLPRYNSEGRFPANIIFGCSCETEEHEEGCPVKHLDEQSGVTKSPKPYEYKGKKEDDSEIYGAGIGRGFHEAEFGDSGGASRFFFVAKPSDFERQRGLRHFKPTDPASVTDFRPTLKSNPENWANGTETPYNRTTQKKNVHPTIKPVELMKYLVRLVTPVGGLCIDPFNGSGTTGIACKLEDINYIGIEQNERDCEVSRARIAVWQNIKQDKLF